MNLLNVLFSMFSLNLKMIHIALLVLIFEFSTLSNIDEKVESFSSFCKLSSTVLFSHCS